MCVYNLLHTSKKMKSICSMGIEPEGEWQTKVILKNIETYPSDDFGERAKRSPNVASLFLFFFVFISANVTIAFIWVQYIAHYFHYCRWIQNGLSPSDACILTDFHTALCMPSTFQLYIFFPSISVCLCESLLLLLFHPPFSFIILSLPSLLLSWHPCSILPACLPNFFFLLMVFLTLEFLSLIIFPRS